MKKIGFTLIELSIVLVIVALMVGGVLTGQTLVHQTRLRAIITEKDRYHTAITIFKDKFYYFPGDLPTAYNFWGTDCGTNSGSASTGCNGNGDHMVNYNDGLGETVKSWEHLSRAGLIEGSFDGVAADGGPYMVLTSSNIPASKFPQAWWSLSNGAATGYGVPAAAGSPPLGGLYLTLLNVNTPLNYYLSAMTNADAWNIDSKTDDGRANTGRLRGHSTACYDSGTDYYRLNGSANLKEFCTLTFILWSR